MKKIITEFSNENIDRFCNQVYTPKIGARGLPARLKIIQKMIVDEMLIDEDFSGKLNVIYDENTKMLKSEWVKHV